LVASVHQETRVETKEEIQAEIVRVFGQDAENALCIAKMESGFRADARNINGNYPAGSVDRGVFQLNSHWQSHISDAEAFDAKSNIAQAKRIFDAWGGTWNAWSARTKCNL
jgi:hypothetical protein